MTLYGRDFLKESDFTRAELESVLDLAAELKSARAAGTEQRRLVGKQIALIFEKTSTRTKISFEVAMRDQGGHVSILDPSTSQIGHKESVADTARVLSSMFDGIEYRAVCDNAGETPHALCRYGRGCLDLAASVGEDPSQYLPPIQAQGTFGRCGISTVIPTIYPYEAKCEHP
jgi:ornithine carbamoyltransferase